MEHAEAEAELKAAYKPDGMRFDHDTMVWTLNGTPMTLVDSPNKGKCLELLHQWLETHCRGEWLTTPSYIGFEDPAEATLFALGFDDDTIRINND